MELVLASKGRILISLDNQMLHEDNGGNTSVFKFKFGHTTSLSLKALRVIDPNIRATQFILDQVSLNLCHVGFQFAGEVGNPKLNLVLASPLFTEIEKIIKKKITISGEIGITSNLGPDRGIKVTIQDLDSEALKNEDTTTTKVYVIRHAKYDNHMCQNFSELAQSFPLRLQMKICIKTYDAKDADADTDKFEVIRNILNDGIAADLTIIASNDAPIKCHKSFLIVHSEMFEGMLNSGMKEPTSNVIEMKTVSEPAVRALLAYLYSWDLKEASNDCEIAVELLKAADYYIIPRLVKDIGDILLKKPTDWFTVDGALDLFLLSNRLDQAQLKTAALQALKMKFEELKSNASYLQLFQKDPTTAMELCNSAWSMQFLEKNPADNENSDQDLPSKASLLKDNDYDSSCPPWMLEMTPRDFNGVEAGNSQQMHHHHPFVSLEQVARGERRVNRRVDNQGNGRGRPSPYIIHPNFHM